MWENGPFACSELPNIKIFKSCLNTMLLPNEKIMADYGYQFHNYRIPNIVSFDQIVVHSRIRARNEACKAFAKKHSHLS